MFYEERNALNTFIRPQGYTKCVLVRELNVNIVFVCLQANCRAPLMWCIHDFCAYASFIHLASSVWVSVLVSIMMISMQFQVGNIEIH